jgi:hypothetical protein
MGDFPIKQKGEAVSLSFALERHLWRPRSIACPSTEIIYNRPFCILNYMALPQHFFCVNLTKYIMLHQLSIINTMFNSPKNDLDLQQNNTVFAFVLAFFPNFVEKTTKA